MDHCSWLSLIKVIQGHVTFCTFEGRIATWVNKNQSSLAKGGIAVLVRQDRSSPSDFTHPFFNSTVGVSAAHLTQ